MASHRPPGYAALRRHRWSAPFTDYFITIVTDGRCPGLAAPELAHPIIAGVKELQGDSHWYLRTATVMPDHLHLLITLGRHGSLPHSLRLLKGRLSPRLRSSGLRWQKGYFEHRVRPGDDRLPIFHYVFLNPYRQGLVSAGQLWPWYYCCEDDWNWFEPMTSHACPYPQWLE